MARNEAFLYNLLQEDNTNRRRLMLVTENPPEQEQRLSLEKKHILVWHKNLQFSAGILIIIIRNNAFHGFIFTAKGTEACLPVSGLLRGYLHEFSQQDKVYGPRIL